MKDRAGKVEAKVALVATSMITLYKRRCLKIHEIQQNKLILQLQCFS